ncbi:MAG: Gx transporter family protein, partial [Bacillota bacterium]
CYRAAHFVSLPSISVVGALFHNIGQLLVAAFLVRTAGIFLYLPLLIVAAGLTGLAVGYTTLFLIRALSKSRMIVVPQKLEPLIE